MTYEEVMDLDAQHIAEHGYMLQGVGDGPDDPHAWTYSMGLLDIAEHPELIVAGAIKRTHMVITALAEAILDGDVFEVGDVIESSLGDARIGPVHVVHYDLDTFNSWHSLRSYGAIHAPELVALEIVMPGHRGPTLADPHSRLGVPPNRAERRRRKRHGHAS